MSTADHRQLTHAEQLLGAVAEQLKTPIIQMAQHAELGHKDALQDINHTARRALRLIDSYLLSAEQAELPLESITVSSVLYDAAQALDSAAKQYGGRIELAVAGKYGPVMAHRDALLAGLVMAGEALLDADTQKTPVLTLAAYKHKEGIRAGVFGRQPGLTAGSFRRTIGLYGSGRRPVAAGSSLNSVGFYLAHELFEHMSTRLYVARHRHLTGLAGNFLPSAQLQLV